MNTELSLIDNNTNSSKNFLKLYNRSNRLVSAVFLVVNVVDGNDQIKNRIKELAMQLMSVCVEIKDENGTSYHKFLSQIEKIIFELLSLLEVASVSGLISEMNASILKSEFQSFLVSISEFSKNAEHINSISTKNILERSDFTSGDVLDKNDSSLYKKTTSFSSVASSSAQKMATSSSIVKDENKGQSRKDSRQNAIVEFVKLHPNANIKEIAPHIRGCGEKTIQRELVELVKSGIVHRVGERRWSRYSVA